MKVKGQLEQAQLENVQTADEVSLTTSMGMVYYNKETNEILVGKNGSLGRVKVALPSNIVGDVRTSALTESEFQTEMVDSTWVLCDGRDVSVTNPGSDWETLTGKTIIPDLRGVYLRGKNNGRSDGNENPDGELSIGDYQADILESHNHSVFIGLNTTVGIAPNSIAAGGGSGSGTSYSTNTGGSGGNETRPKSVTVNYFIKINR